ncbi:MAG: ABC transporter permease, partial [Chloroflexia bacterium]
GGREDLLMNAQSGMSICRQPAKPDKTGSRGWSPNRLISTMWCDVRLQFRNGFYYATAFVTVAYALAISQLRGTIASDMAALLPVFVLDSMVVGTFYFVAGLVLLEKGDGTLEALVVSPLKPWEYLASKVITLASLSIAQYLVVVILFAGLNLGTLAVILGVALAAAIYILIGFISVIRYTSISDYLVPSIPYTGFLLLPLATYVLGLGQGTTIFEYLILLHPLEAPLKLLQAAFMPVDAWQIAYGLLYSGFWIFLLGRLSLRSFARYVVEKAGTGSTGNSGSMDN